MDLQETDEIPLNNKTTKLCFPFCCFLTIEQTYDAESEMTETTVLNKRRLLNTITGLIVTILCIIGAGYSMHTMFAHYNNGPLTNTVNIFGIILIFAFVGFLLYYLLKYTLLCVIDPEWRDLACGALCDCLCCVGKCPRLCCSECYNICRTLCGSRCSNIVYE